jgi:hypothetical protein
MNTPLVALLIGVPLWFLLDFFGVRVLRDPIRTLTDAEYLDWHNGATFASHVLQALRNLLALGLFYSGIVLSMLDPQERQWFDGTSMLSLVGSGLLAGATFRLATIRLTPAHWSLVYLWRATPALFILVAVLNSPYPSSVAPWPSWAVLPLSLLPVFVLVAEHVLRICEEAFARRWTLLPIEVPLCDHCDREGGVRAVVLAREGIHYLNYLCPICAERDPDELFAEDDTAKEDSDQ